MSRGVKGLKIGVPKEYRMQGMPEEIERLWAEGARWLAAAGAELVDVSLPHTAYALPAYYIVAPRKHPRTSRAMTGSATAFASKGAT